VAVQSNANPAARARVRRNEESIGVRVDHDGLISRRGFAPDRRTSGAVMVLGVRVHGEHLVANAERGLAPCLDLVRLGQGETQLSASSEWAGRHLDEWILGRRNLAIESRIATGNW